MNTINFIKPIPPKRQRNLDRWFKFTLYSLIVLLSYLSCTTGYKAILVMRTKQRQHEIQQTIQSCESNILAIHKHQEQNIILSKHLEKVSRIKNNPILPTPYLHELSCIIPAQVALTSYKQESNNHVVLEGKGIQTNSIIAFLHALKGSSLFENMELTSMQYQKNKENALLYFVIKGSLKKTS
jgi:Tfp pilus assembly protein PilN